MNSEPENTENATPAGGATSRVGAWLGRPARWIMGCVVAGLAIIVTSAATDFGRSSIAAIEDGYCSYKLTKNPETSRFRVVVARLTNDDDGEVQERIASRLVPTSFSVVRGCAKGPARFDENGLVFNERVRAEATKQLAALSADVLIFGRVEDDKVELRFADRDGYCSNVAEILPIADLDQPAAQSAFARALANRIIKALVSDCESRKLNALSEPQLKQLSQKIDLLVEQVGTTGEPDVKTNLWFYRAWVRARLAQLGGSANDTQQLISSVLAGAPDAFAKATSLWGLSTFADRNNMPALKQLVLDEAYIAYGSWKPLSPGWISMALLAHERILRDHAADPGWKLAHYDAMTDRIGGNGADFVPVSEADYYRPFYRFGKAATETPHATDRQVESAVSVLSDLLAKKLAGKPVPITTNSIRYALAEALILSAARQKTPSRLARAGQLVDFITAHPDDSKELTPEVMGKIRSRLDAACTRQRCAGPAPVSASAAARDRPAA